MPLYKLHTSYINKEKEKTNVIGKGKQILIWKEKHNPYWKMKTKV